MSNLARVEYTGRYHPVARFEGDIADLFSDVRITKHMAAPPANDAPELWLNIEGVFNGKSVYVTPCRELDSLIGDLSIYGLPKHKDVYIKVWKRDRGAAMLGVQYQQLIGGYTLLELTAGQYQTLVDYYSDK